MTSCLLKTCCGCMKLKTGCLIIAYLNLVIAIIGLVLALLVAEGVATLLADDNSEASQVLATTDFGVAFSILISLLVIYLAFNIVFLVGIYQNKSGHVMAYLVFSVVFLVIDIVLFFTDFAGSVTAGEICLSLFFILLALYSTLVTRSYYYQMKATSRQPANHNIV